MDEGKIVGRRKGLPSWDRREVRVVVK